MSDDLIVEYSLKNDLSVIKKALDMAWHKMNDNDHTVDLKFIEHAESAIKRIRKYDKANQVAVAYERGVRDGKRAILQERRNKA